MKTPNSRKTFPNRKSIVVYIVSVGVFCSMSIMVPKARDYESQQANAQREYVRSLIEVDSEPALNLESWMFDFHSEE